MFDINRSVLVKKIIHTSSHQNIVGWNDNIIGVILTSDINFEVVKGVDPGRPMLDTVTKLVGFNSREELMATLKQWGWVHAN